MKKGTSRGAMFPPVAIGDDGEKENPTLNGDGHVLAS